MAEFWNPTGPPAVTTSAPAPATGPLTYQQVFDRVGTMLDDSWLTVADTFLGTFPAANLPVHGRDAFLSSAVWASIGHSVAAAVGASFSSPRRSLVLCGDGGFHMTAQAIATLARHQRNPVVIVLDNGLYAYEQFLINPGYFGHPSAQPRSYTVLDRWDYVAFAHALGVPNARVVTTAAELDAALAAAKTAATPMLIAARLDPHSAPADLT